MKNYKLMFFLVIVVLLSITSVSAIPSEIRGSYLANKLFSYYKFDETSGTTATDSLANGTNGVITGVTLGTTGILNTAYDFESGDTTDKVEYTSPAWCGFTDNDWTLNFWFKPESSTTGQQIYGCDGNALIVYFEAANDIRIGKAFVDNAAGSTFTISDGVMTMVTIRKNATGTYYNKNGGSKEFQTYTTTFAAGTTGTIGNGAVGPLDGVLDEFFIANRTLNDTEVTDLYNSGLALMYGDPTGVTNITLNSPVNNYNSTNTTIIFNATVTDTMGVGNVTFFLNGVADTFNNSHFNGTYLFSKTVSVALNQNWSIGSVNLNGTVTNSSTRFFNITNFSVNSQTYNATTTETFTESFSTNITLASGLSLTSASFIYNGTSYSASINSTGNNRILSRTINIPNVSASTNMTFYWSLVLDNGAPFISNTTATLQLVNDINIDNCLTNTFRIINYTIYDEDNRFKLKNTSYNLSSSVYVKLSADFGGTTYEYYATNTSQNSINICVANALVTGQNYRLDSIIQFTANDYVTEHHYLENFTLNTSSQPQNISLYLLASNRSQEFLITYKDANLIPVPSAIITLTRQYLSLGSFLPVEVMKTDNDGKTIGHFVLNDEVYTVYVFVDGQLVATYENVQAFCSNILTGDCRINLNQLSSTSNPQDFRHYQGITSTEDYNDSTKTHTFTFISDTGGSKTINVTVTKYDNYLNDTICSNSLISSSGTITCVIPASYYNNSAQATIYVDGVLYSTSVFDITPSRASELNGSRYFLAFMILLTLPLMAISSGVMVLMMFLLGFILAVTLGVLDLGGYVGISSAFLWFVIAVVILIWKINKEENK